MRIKLFVLLSILLFQKNAFCSDVFLSQNRIDQYIDEAEKLFKIYFFDFTMLFTENQIEYEYKSQKIKEMLGYFDNHKQIIENDMQSYNMFSKHYTIEEYLTKVAIANPYESNYSYTTNYKITKPIRIYFNTTSKKYFFYIYYDRIITKTNNLTRGNNASGDVETKKMILEIFTKDGIDFYIEKFGEDLGKFDPLKKGMILVKPKPQTSLSSGLIEKCVGDIDALKSDMDFEYLKISRNILKEFNVDRAKYEDASPELDKLFKNELYKVISEKLVKLKGRESNINSNWKIFVDSTGKMVDYKEEIVSYKLVENYNSLRETVVLPYLKSNAFRTNVISYSYSNAYQDLYNKYKDKINKTQCPDKFDDMLSFIKNRFKPYENMQLSKATLYNVPIKFKVVNENYVWTSYKNKISVSNKLNKDLLSDSLTIKDFYSKTKGKTNGKFSVTASYITYPNDSTAMVISQVDRKYRFFTHIGGTASTLIPISDKVAKSEYLELYTYNAFLIYHRIGIFGGSVYRSEKALNGKNLNGKYFDDIKLYLEGGMYLGIAQYFYLKAGYTYLNASFVQYQNSVVETNFGKKVSHGFLTGLSFIFPYMQVEVGYNYGFRSPYAGLGTNIPINR